MILAYIETIPTIIQILKQIKRQELLKLMPLEWLTNDDQFHQNSELVQTSLADKPSLDPPRLSYTAMITTISTGQ